MSSNDKCIIDNLKDSVIDPYSRGGKIKIGKAHCTVSSILTKDGTVFLVGQPVSKEVILAKGYFTLDRKFDESKGTWKSDFSPVTAFEDEKILITGSGGPKQNGLVITPDKAALISRALDKVKILNESL